MFTTTRTRTLKQITDTLWITVDEISEIETTRVPALQDPHQPGVRQTRPALRISMNNGHTHTVPQREGATLEDMIRNIYRTGDTP